MNGSYKLTSKEWKLIADIFIIFSLFILFCAIVFYFLFLDVPLNPISIIEIILISLVFSVPGSFILFLVMWQTIISKQPEMISKSIIFTAHQLRAPATGVKWALGSLLTSETLAPHDKELISQSFESISQVVEIASDLLGAAQLQEADSLHFKEIDIIPVARAAIKEFSLRAHEKNIELVFENQSKENEIRAVVDPDKIFSVITNLLDNAIRYSQRDSRVTMLINKDDKNVSIVVRDSGIGIPKNDQANVFTGFFRAANVRALEPNGSGIGLYMCKNIVTRHKGKIWFESAEGKGTAFFMRLPLKHT